MEPEQVGRARKGRQGHGRGGGQGKGMGRLTDLELALWLSVQDGATDWACPACTFVNAAARVRCEMCGTAQALDGLGAGGGGGGGQGLNGGAASEYPAPIVQPPCGGSASDPLGEGEEGETNGDWLPLPSTAVPQVSTRAGLGLMVAGQHRMCVLVCPAVLPCPALNGVLVGGGTPGPMEGHGKPPAPPSTTKVARGPKGPTRKGRLQHT